MFCLYGLLLKVEHTTILFADLSGFTKWSSDRSPEEVFLLLESIYGAFDAIAEKLGVFKVEVSHSKCTPSMVCSVHPKQLNRASR